MRRSFVATALVATAVCWTVRGPTPAAPKVKPRGPTADEVRKRLFGTCRYETGKVIAGKQDPNEPLGWKFGADEAENWQITGELVTYRMFGGATIDVSRTPWRLDILSRDDRGRVSVLPTIFKFEGDTLVWATEFPGEGWYSVVDPAGDYKGRPTGFDSTEANRYAVYRLKPCEYLQTSPPK
ncbi:MAG TPA: hypothetical protein VM597_31540 [Gemmataceae bacterium]|nr:hypothetical protein [Gemmataceae bacterium]